MPAIEHIHQAYKDQGLIVLGINASSQDPVTNALAFVKENNLTFPVLFDQEAQAYELYAVRALPTTYFIAPDGKIQEVIVGGPISEALLRVRVQHLLAMPER